MSTRIILAALSIAALSSCSTSYKAQTPDDVYYSPARPQEEYVNVETQKEREADRYEDYTASDDRYLRWKVRNRNRWSTFDDYGYDWYGYNSGWSYNKPWGNYWNSYYSWNNYYNPYCGRVIIVNPKTNAPVYNRIRTYTPGTYTSTYNNSNNSSRGKFYRPGSQGSTFENGNRNTLGNSIRKIFNNSNGSYNNGSSGDSRTYTPSSSDRPSRSYQPSTNSSSSSSSGSSSSGSSGSSSGSRPGRGN